MPETLLRLPRTPLTRAKYPAIDFHVHAGNLRTVEAYQTFIKKMDEAGIDLSKPVVTSCGSGVTAAIVSLALETLGHSGHKLYDGSWTEWGGRSDTPVVTGKE